MSGDASLIVALKIAGDLGQAPEPPWVGDVDKSIHLVQLIQEKASPKFVRGEPMPMLEFCQRLDAAFADWASDPMSAPGIDSITDRKNVLLRLWAGCVWTGKMIALGTKSGDTSPEDRAAFFRDWVVPWSSGCKVYAAGALHACAWKKKALREPVCLDGVPEPWKAHYQLV